MELIISGEYFMSQHERFRRVLTELLIIVTGVLIALGAQPAAHEWADRRDERAFLLDLLAEFQLNESQLQKDIEQTGQAVAAADMWRDTRAGATAVEGDTVADFYAASMNGAR